MAEIKSTTNYEIFKKLPMNRAPFERHILRLMASIEKQNCLSSCPIIVDKEMQVIDGGHRLEAARRLGVPIFYTVMESATPEAMVRLNEATMRWTNEDFLNFFMESGNRNYAELHLFMLKYDITLKLALRLLVGGKSHEFMKAFKLGQFHFSLEKVDSAKLRLNQIAEVQSYIKERRPSDCSFVNQTHFASALLEFLSHPDVSYQQFLKNLAFRCKILGPETSSRGFIEKLEEIYNFRNQSPISVA